MYPRSSILGGCKEQLSSGSSHRSPGGLALPAQSHGQAGDWFCGSRDVHMLGRERQNGPEETAKLLQTFARAAGEKALEKNPGVLFRPSTGWRECKRRSGWSLYSPCCAKERGAHHSLDASRRQRNTRLHPLFCLLTATNF